MYVCLSYDKILIKSAEGFYSWWTACKWSRQMKVKHRSTVEKSYRSVTIVILVTVVANEVGRDTQGDQTCQIRWQDPMCAIVVWTCQLSWAVHHGGDQTFKTRTYWQYVQNKNIKREPGFQSLKRKTLLWKEWKARQSKCWITAFVFPPTDLQLDFRNYF